MGVRWTEEQLQALTNKRDVKPIGIANKGTAKDKKKNKYNAKKTEVDGITFDSALEARRYDVLKLLQQAGVITNLTLQPSWEIIPKQTGNKKNYQAAKYTADFKYKENGEWVVEDVKSVETAKKPDYILRKKLLFFVHGIEIKEYFK